MHRLAFGIQGAPSLLLYCPGPSRHHLHPHFIQQYAGDQLGQILYDARTGESIKRWYMPATGDVGRGECMDIDRAHLGWEMWSTMDGNMYDAKGNLISGYSNQYPRHAGARLALGHQHPRQIGREHV